MRRSDAGFLAVVGSIFCAASIGYMYGVGYGWMALGVALMTFALIGLLIGEPKTDASKEDKNV